MQKTFIARVYFLTTCASCLAFLIAAETATAQVTEPEPGAENPPVAAAPVQGRGDQAQTTSDSMGDIIVTANRRAERLQDVPIAITAVTSASLASAGVTNTSEIAQVVPGLVYQNSQSGVQAHLRGVGTTALPAGTENSIATYIDGVYILSMSGALLQLNSIDQIEVLKGPQGTLFGRNATGGVINVRTRDPSQTPGGDFSIGYANYDTFSAQAYVTAGLSPTLAVDIAGVVSLQGDGWGTNVANGQDVYTNDTYALRTKWLFTPSDRDDFRLAADYSRADGNAFSSFRLVDGSVAQYGPGSTLAAARPDLLRYLGPALAPFAEVGNPYAFNGKPYDIAMFTQPDGRVENWGASLQWDHEFGAFRTQSITAYRALESRQRWGATPVPAFRTQADFLQRDNQFSQELQIASLSSSRIQWLVGLYYLNGGSDFDPFFITGTAISPLQRLLFHALTSTESGAAFGQATIPLGSSTNLTLGGRYTIEKRGIEGDTVLSFLPGFGPPELVTDPTDADETFRKFTWRVSLDHRFSPEVLGYASFNRGFKSGVYNSVPPGGATAQAVDPEVLDAYEIGIKTNLFDRVVQLNASAFFYDYQDLQVTVFTPISALLDNGARAEVYGLDLDLVVRPTPQLRITGGLGWMHSEFKEYPNAQFLVPEPASAGGGNTPVSGDAAGNRLPYAPDFTANIGINYEIPLRDGKVVLGANYSYNDGWFAGPDNILSQPSYGIANVLVNWELGEDGPRVGLWARNLFDEQYHVFLSAGNNPGGYNQGIRGAPRTYGVTLGYSF